MKARAAIGLVAAAAVIAIAAVALLRGDAGSRAARSREAASAQDAAAVAAAAAPAPPQPSDAELRLLAEVEEERGTWRSLRDAFAAAPARANAESEARLATALRAASDSVKWALSCRASLCRVSADAPPIFWRGLLGDAPSLRAVSERIAAPPEGEEVAYVALAPAAASRGHDLLRDVETELLQSSDARYCLSSVDARGAIAYDLRVDSSGYTYRISTDLPRPVVECVNDVLADILRLSPVPPEGATLATRSFGIHR